MSADGKIADARRSPARFSSQRDRFHLEQQIAAADATLFGAGTLRAYGTTLSVSHPKLLYQRIQFAQSSQPIQILASASANLDPQWRFFRQPVPRWLLTSTAGAKYWQARSEFERVIVGEWGVGSGEWGVGSGEQGRRGTRGQGELGVPTEWGLGVKGTRKQFQPLTNNTQPTNNYQPPTIDWTFALQQLFSLGIKRLAVLGGGELVAAMLAVDLIDEMWLTVCPLLLGGTNAPTPVAGSGFPENLAPRLELLSAQAEGQEVFLHYRLQRSRQLD
jgi:5-amino-6-(5-phosphoribosylamino)uracil reductase